MNCIFPSWTRVLCFLAVVLLLPGAVFGQARKEDTPKNIILMIGDGMGLSQVAALNYTLKGQSAFDRFTQTGFVKTYSASHRVTDSAAGATAMACGVKTYNNAIGMTVDTVACKNILEFAEERGLGTGIVVSSSVTHATPASFVAHQPFRALQEQIAADYLNLDIDCVIGGGQVYFKSRFVDERHLLDELEQKGYTVESFQRKDLRQLEGKEMDKLYYFTGLTEPLPKLQGRDYLPYAVEFAAKFLEARFPEGFILIVEGSQIDFAGHAQDEFYLIQEMLDFNSCLENALDFAENEGNTLVVVTADHSTGALTFKEGNPDRKPKLKFLINKHTEEMVPIFSYGPGQQEFSGIMENTDIFYRLRFLLNL